LEGIHLLGLGRSFRGSGVRPLVREGRPELVVFALLQSNDGERHRVGLKKTRQGGMEIRVDGRRAGSAAELAEILPLQLMTPGSHVLVEGSPKERRAFLDWALFHVEHGFFRDWKVYQRALRQRNRALKEQTRSEDIQLWDKSLTDAGERMTSQRQAYVEALRPVVARYIGELVEEASDKLELEYSIGWPGDTALDEALRRGLERDRRSGFTSMGPHRGDLRLRWAGRPAAEQLSRGQQKLVVAALKLAQMELLKESANKACVILVDDLPAELDREHRAKFLKLLAATDAQAFITATEKELVDVSSWPDHKMFHVEHGTVAEML